MTVLQTLREFHAQDILSVRMDSLHRLTGLTQSAVDAEVVSLKKQGLLLVDRGYAVLAAPPSTDRDDDEVGKQCATCRKTKPVREFWKQPTCKDGLRGSCKACCLIQQHATRRGRPRKEVPRRRCRVCDKRKPLYTAFATIGDNPLRYSTTCLMCEADRLTCDTCGVKFASQHDAATCANCRLEWSMARARREALCGVSP